MVSDVADGVASAENAGGGSRRDAVVGTNFRPLGRRRGRVLLGVLLCMGAVGGNLVLYASMDARTEVLQVVRDVPAGAVLHPEDLRPIEAWLDPTITAIGSEQLASVIGSYARVRLAAGALLVAEALQSGPLVAPDAAVVSVRIADGEVPIGLRERSQVLVVIPPPTFSEFTDPQIQPAFVVAPPAAVPGATGVMAISLEVAVNAAVLIAVSEQVRLVLVEPHRMVAAEDLITEPSGSSQQGS